MAGLSIKPITKNYVLDYDGISTVEIKQATTGAVRRLAELFADQTQVFDSRNPNLSQVRRNWNYETLKMERVYATLCGSDLKWEDETPVFRFKESKNGSEIADKSEFMATWDRLPPELAEEIYRCVIDLNIIWDPDRMGE